MHSRGMAKSPKGALTKTSVLNEVLSCEAAHEFSTAMFL